MTALHTAVKVRRLDIARFLVEKGGEVEDKAPFGKSNSKKNAVELMYLHHKDIKLLDSLEIHIKSVCTCNNMQAVAMWGWSRQKIFSS